MPILYAEIQIAGLRALCAAVSFSFIQATDYAGRPNSTVHVGLLRVLLVGEAAAWPVWEALKFDPYRRHSGHVVFFGGEGQTARRLTFYDAALVHYQTRFSARGQNREASLETELHFSAATVEVQGQRLEAHSVIPWVTDAATSFRALTTPADPLPSPNLAALVAAGAVRAEQLAGGLVQRVVTAGGEVATEVLGVGLAALARAASLTAGLVVLPANDADAPGYEAEKNLGRAGKDAARLAYLESEQAHRALSAEEQQELGALLAKVRGIHVQELEDIDKLEINIPPEDKLDRNLLNPPVRHGNAPKFKRDGTSVEIHHEGQNREGPFKEMHWDEHRGKGNDKINHPNKSKPSRVDRDEFERAKRRYWKKEYPKK